MSAANPHGHQGQQKRQPCTMSVPTPMDLSLPTSPAPEGSYEQFSAGSTTNPNKLATQGPAFEPVYSPHGSTMAPSAEECSPAAMAISSDTAMSAARFEDGLNRVISNFLSLWASKQVSPLPLVPVQEYISQKNPDIAGVTSSSSQTPLASEPRTREHSPLSDTQQPPVKKEKAVLDPFRCNICNVECLSSANLQKHRSGQKHIRHEKLAEEDEELERKINVKEEGLEKIDVGHWRCADCDMKISGALCALAHVNGNRHKSMRADKQLEKEIDVAKQGLTRTPTGVWKCNLCTSEMTGSSCVLSHISGSRHIKNLNRQRLASAQFAERPPAPVSPLRMLSDTLTAPVAAVAANAKEDGKKKVVIRSTVPKVDYDSSPTAKAGLKAIGKSQPNPLPLQQFSQPQTLHAREHQSPLPSQSQILSSVHTRGQFEPQSQRQRQRQPQSQSQCQPQLHIPSESQSPPQLQRQVRGNACTKSGEQSDSNLISEVTTQRRGKNDTVPRIEKQYPPHVPSPVKVKSTLSAFSPEFHPSVPYSSSLRRDNDTSALSGAQTLSRSQESLPTQGVPENSMHVIHASEPPQKPVPVQPQTPVQQRIPLLQRTSMELRPSDLHATPAQPTVITPQKAAAFQRPSPGQRASTPQNCFVYQPAPVYRQGPVHQKAPVRQEAPWSQRCFLQQKTAVNNSAFVQPQPPHHQPSSPPNASSCGQNSVQQDIALTSPMRRKTSFVRQTPAADHSGGAQKASISHQQPTSQQNLVQQQLSMRVQNPAAAQPSVQYSSFPRQQSSVTQQSAMEHHSPVQQLASTSQRPLVQQPTPVQQPVSVELRSPAQQQTPAQRPAPVQLQNERRPIHQQDSGDQHAPLVQKIPVPQKTTAQEEAFSHRQQSSSIQAQNCLTLLQNKEQKSMSEHQEDAVMVSEGTVRSSVSMDIDIASPVRETSPGISSSSSQANVQNAVMPGQVRVLTRPGSKTESSERQSDVSTSSKARKKSKNPVQEFRCEVCGISCNSQYVLMSHLNSPKHLRRLENMRTFPIASSSARVASHSAKTRSGSQQATVDRTQSNISATQSSQRTGSSSSGRTKKQTGNIFCLICKVSCTSTDNYNDHIKGKGHAKQLQIQARAQSASANSTTSTSAMNVTTS